MFSTFSFPLQNHTIIIVDIDNDGNKKKKVNWHAGLFVFLLTVEFGRGVKSIYILYLSESMDPLLFAVLKTY